MKQKFPTVMAFVFGALPFLIGGVQNWYMLTYMDSVLPYGLISLAMLLLWGCIAFFLHNRNQKTAEIVISLNLIPALDLLLVGVQELIYHAYWANRVGLWSQLFYLPMINLGVKFTIGSHSMFPAYAACFVLMAAVSFVGCKLKQRIQK